MNKRLIAALFAAGAGLGALPAAAEIVLYGRENFEGRSLQVQGPNGDLRSQNFNDRASSAVVVGRAYEVCDDVGFGGRCMVLRPGRYPHLSSMGLSDSISSVRPSAAPIRRAWSSHGEKYSGASFGWAIVGAMADSSP